MQSTRFLVFLAVALVFGGAALTAGCFNYQNDCLYTLQCASMTSGTGGGDGGLPTSCDPTLSATAVADSCGTFVSPLGDDSNTGTQKLPLKTLTAAVAKGGTIYACEGTTPYTEALVIGQPVTLFGALDCTTWIFQAGHRSQLTAAAGAVPLTLSGKATGTLIEDFAVTSADATMPGGSSIAVVDDQVSATLKDVDVIAGKGANGTVGAMPPAQVATPTTANGAAGADDAACNVTGTLGGAPGINMCTGVSTNGGVGGQGIVATPGSPGTGGTPMSTPSNGGAGQTGTMACGTGTVGAMGITGQPGTGAQRIGDVSASGYQAPLATAGTSAGLPGQGGGGGGSAKQCGGAGAGPSGGGGGAGGCGGAPGVPGTSAGSSIGILTLDATLTLTSVTITTHVGGAGGAGGDGQVGGNGGTAGASGGSGACGGGPGGQGGIGGGGGGGAGGHSVGVAVKGGTAPDLKGTMVVHALGGAGGLGGNMDMTPATKGDDGLGCSTLDFGNPMSTMACVM